MLKSEWVKALLLSGTFFPSPCVERHRPMGGNVIKLSWTALLFPFWHPQRGSVCVWSSREYEWRKSQKLRLWFLSAPAREGPQLLLKALLSYFWVALIRFLSSAWDSGSSYFLLQCLCLCPLLSVIKGGTYPCLVAGAVHLEGSLDSPLFTEAPETPQRKGPSRLLLRGLMEHRGWAGAGATSCPPLFSSSPSRFQIHNIAWLSSHRIDP